MKHMEDRASTSEKQFTCVKDYESYRMLLNQKEDDSVIPVHPFQHGQFPGKIISRRSRREGRMEKHIPCHECKLPVCILPCFPATYSGSPLRKERFNQYKLAAI
jgi:hypothetical protein